MTLFILITTPCYNQSIDTLQAIYKIITIKDNHSLIHKIEELASKKLYFTHQNPEIPRQLIDYAENRPNVQGQVLTLLLVNYGRLSIAQENFDELHDEFDEGQVKNAMQMARASNDKYVLANAYWIYGRIQWHLEQYESMLVYYNAAYEMYSELDIPESEYVNKINFDISAGSYSRYDFRNSVDYSLQCYGRMHEPSSKIKGLHKLYLLDLLGAGYQRLGIPDSSTYYYNQLLEVLNVDQNLFTKNDQELWTAIAEGRIGKNYLEQRDITRALPMITRFYTESNRLKSTLNILLSTHSYAWLKYELGESDEALRLWKEALSPSTAHGMDYLSENICRGITMIYTDRQNIDSTVHYLEKADHIRRGIDRIIYRSSRECNPATI